MSKKLKFRIAWKSDHNGQSGHGEYIPEEEARALLEKEIKDWADWPWPIKHWLEPEPTTVQK